MGVIAEWRGFGIGKRLLVETVAAADAEKFLRIELSVHSDNLRAISLHRDFGFVEEGRKIKAPPEIVSARGRALDGPSQAGGGMAAELIRSAPNCSYFAPRADRRRINK